MTRLSAPGANRTGFRTGLTVCAAAFIGCLLMFAFVPFDVLRGWMREDGFFETGSIIGYWIATLACLFLAMRGHDTWFHAATALLMFLLSAREMDWHKKFTTASILKSNYYLKMHVPARERLIAGVVIVLILAFLIYYAIKYLPPFLRKLRARNAAAITVGCTLAVLVFTKIMDRLINILKDDYNLTVSEWLVKFQLSTEEPLEMLIPILVLVALYQAQRERGANTAHPP